MDRDNSVEKHLLSRSFDATSQIVEIFDKRYSVFGGQKPFIPLVPTEGDSKSGDSKDEKKEETEKDSKDSKNQGPRGARIPKKRKGNTRFLLKQYLKTTKTKQVRGERYVQLNPNMNIDQLTARLQIPVYEDYIELNKLWNNYMVDLLFGENKKPNINMALPKLSTADFHGCKMRVLESRNRNLVGIEGIVLHDAQNSLFVVVQQKKDKEDGPTVSAAEKLGGIRSLAKEGTLFGFDVETNNKTIGFTLMGSRFEHRSTDRSGRKFKAHNVKDIL